MMLARTPLSNIWKVGRIHAGVMLCMVNLFAGAEKRLRYCRPEEMKAIAI
jgi:hypothetical protein